METDVEYEKLNEELREIVDDAKNTINNIPKEHLDEYKKWLKENKKEWIIKFL